MTVMFASLRPFDPDRGLKLRRFTTRGVMFQQHDDPAKRRWYKITDESLARQLMKVRSSENDRNSPFAFDVVTEDQALQMEDAAGRGELDVRDVEDFLRSGDRDRERTHELEARASGRGDMTTDDLDRGRGALGFPGMKKPARPEERSSEPEPGLPDEAVQPRPTPRGRQGASQATPRPGPGARSLGTPEGDPTPKG